MCFVESLPSLVKVFVRHILNHKSDWVENKEVVKSRKVFVKAIETSSSRSSVHILAVPAGLSPMQTFPGGYYAFCCECAQRRGVA